MKIALVSPYDLAVPGGVQSHVLRLAASLRSSGDQVSVLGPGAGDGTQLGLGRTLPMRFNGSVAPVALSPLAIRRTRRLLARIAPDVVHVHEPLVPFVGLAAAATRVAPVVATFHAWSADDRLYRLARPVGRRVLERVAVAIAVSSAAADYHAGALGVGPDRFEIVPNGVDVARFAGAVALPGHGPGTDPTLLFVGRLERRKGLEVLMRAFVELRRRHPRVRLLVVGEGPERDRCEGLLPARDAHGVTFLGRLDDRELARAFASAEVFVSPALGGESFGIVLLEAMAAGRAVVASDLPGYRTVIVDGQHGRLVPPGDPDALGHALGGLLDDPGGRQRLVAAGRAHADEFDWGVVAARLRSRYERAVQAGGPGRR